jgi:hypothetical protein
VLAGGRRGRSHHEGGHCAGGDAVVMDTRPVMANRPRPRMVYSHSNSGDVLGTENATWQKKVGLGQNGCR